MLDSIMVKAALSEYYQVKKNLEEVLKEIEMEESEYEEFNKMMGINDLKKYEIYLSEISKWSQFLIDEKIANTPKDTKVLLTFIAKNVEKAMDILKEEYDV